MGKRHLYIVLFLLAGLRLAAQTSAPQPQALNVTTFGAKGDGITLNTRCIQAAIDSAAARYTRTADPQVLLIPQGRYLGGTIYLKSGVTLRLSRDAVLLGSTNPFDYVKDPVCRLMAFVFAVGQHDIAIDGLFLAIGHRPNSDIFRPYVKTDETGYILTEEGTPRTGIPGVFAAGDVCDPFYRQACVAAAKGCVAAIDVERFLQLGN